MQIRLNDRLLRALALAALVAGAPLHAAGQLASHPDRESALALAQTVDSRPTVNQLYAFTVSGSTPEALNLLQLTRNRGDWPLPARDLALQRYAEQLRDLPASAVATELLDWLEAHEPLTWVPHEDHAGGLVPLFNLRATIAGVQNAWQRQEAMLEGLALLNSSARALADAWLIETRTASRAGYLQALEQAGDAQLRQLGRHAARRASRQPELAPLAGYAALLGGQFETLAEVLTLEPSADTARLLRAAGQRLEPADAARLLARLVKTAPAPTASLAIAALHPRAPAETSKQLLQLLGDPVLGASAALALAHEPGSDLQARLRKLSKSADPVTAARARLALAPQASMEDARP